MNLLSRGNQETILDYPIKILLQNFWLIEWKLRKFS
jgi:hypothetical protein